VRSARLVLAILLAAAPVAPLALDDSGAVGAACCPLGGSMECCPLAHCSMGRCRSPEPAAIPALPPVVIAAALRVGEPAFAPLPPAAPLPALESATLDLPDPPPRD
jgi:hypothetical protein